MYVRDNITATKICEKTGFSRWIVWKQTKAILNLIGVELVEELKEKNYERNNNVERNRRRIEKTKREQT